MIVWIASAGESCEGSHVLGIFSTKDKAIECALSKSTHFDNHKWTLHDEIPDWWENGCDYVTVYQWEVDTVYNPDNVYEDEKNDYD